MNEALRFIEENKDKPFFCYLPFTPPHGMYDASENELAWKLCEGENGSRSNGAQDAKNYAVMVSMIDRQSDRSSLEETQDREKHSFLYRRQRWSRPLVPKTALAVFSVPTPIPGQKSSSAEGKAPCQEGAIPPLVRPGQIKAGQVSDHIFYQPDVLPTLTEFSVPELPRKWTVVHSPFARRKSHRPKTGIS